MKIRITATYGDATEVEFEGSVSEWLKVLRENCGAEEQTGSTEDQILRELAIEGRFVFAGFVGIYYTVEVVEILIAAN
jgi:hypothetical protein